MAIKEKLSQMVLPLPLEHKLGNSALLFFRIASILNLPCSCALNGHLDNRNLAGVCQTLFISMPGKTCPGKFISARAQSYVCLHRSKVIPL